MARHSLRFRILMAVLAVGLVAVIGLLVQAHFSPEQTLDIATGVPSFDGGLADRLCRGTDSELQAFCAEVDGQSLLDAFHILFEHIDKRSLEALARSLESCLPALDHLARALAEQGYTRGALAEVHRLRDTPLHETLRALRMKELATSLYNDPTIQSAEKYRRMEALADSLQDFSVSLAYVESRLVELAADAGMHERKRQHLRRSIELARNTGRYPMLSQLLGTLCDDLLAAGDRDAALALADEALDVAMQARIPMQAGRVYYILGADHAKRGELSLASDYYDAAVEVAHHLDGRYSELRFLVIKLRFQADLGCWDLVGRSLPRIDLLAQNVPAIEAEPLHLMIWEPTMRLTAAYMTRTGNDSAADSLYAVACDLARQFPRDYIYAQGVTEWAAWLVSHGQPARGIELADEGLSYATGEGLERNVRKLHGVMARGHLEEGRLDAAEEHMSAMLAIDTQQNDGAFDDAILGLRIAGARHDLDRTRVMADVAVRELVSHLSGWGTRLEMYLMLHRHDFFREMLHTQFATSVDDGLALELAWRGLREFAATSSEPDLDAFLEFGRQRVMALRHWCYRHGDRALIFNELGTELGRWQVRADDISYHALPRDEVESLLNAGAASLATAAMTGALPDTELKETLEQATGILLPPWIIDETGGRLLLGVPPLLAGLPLEACDTDPGPGYQPMGARWQVAYIARRGVTAPSTSDKTTSCVVGVPRPSAALQRQQPGLRYLPHVESEARRAAAALPSSTLLMGSTALKSATLEAMGRSRLIYVAGHATQDPDMPYRTFLPCAVDPTSADPRHARLSLADILAQDLDGCDLVVLSNCRSGSGRTTRHTVGPALADAFTDAGAGAVIATRWPVEDSIAAAVMPRVLEHWQGDGITGAWEKLAGIQREEMDRSAAWLNYRLELAILPD